MQRPILILTARDAVEGRVRMAVKLSGNGSAIVEVIDQGPGISPENEAKVFERFYRIDRGRAGEQSGAGLGLAIAHWATEANGGRIELMSQVGWGSTFRIVVPARR